MVITEFWSRFQIHGPGRLKDIILRYTDENAASQ